MNTHSASDQRDRRQADDVLPAERDGQGRGEQRGQHGAGIAGAGDAQRRALVLGRIPGEASGRATAKEAPARPSTQPSSRIAAKLSMPIIQADSSPAMTTIWAPMPTRLALKRSTSRPSTTRRAAPASTGVATIRPLWAAIEMQVLGDGDAERARAAPRP